MSTVSPTAMPEPDALEFHPATPQPLRDACDAINKVIWVIEWVDDDGQHQAEFWINTDRPVPRIGLTMYVRNSDDPEDLVLKPLDVSQDVTPFQNAAQQVRELIHSFLAHEADERIRLNGIPVFHPHYEIEGDLPANRVAQIAAERERWGLVP